MLPHNTSMKPLRNSSSIEVLAGPTLHITVPPSPTPTAPTFTCEYCYQNFPDEEDFETHMAHVHYCDIRDYNFYDTYPITNPHYSHRIPPHFNNYSVPVRSCEHCRDASYTCMFNPNPYLLPINPFYTIDYSVFI